ncbi:alpha/beta fold hydrolase [Amycolatopsis anabasis]|uniref:alpha/beta fold hydrolase n=1 Tax=Amycolatopsis anabasis TaxID=1840409 RepID=UPI00131A878F|nr:alpha/beta hydrolase [Amycolatopsis anabasis]
MKPIQERAAAFERAHESRELRTGALHWHYRTGGSGEPVLLLTGGVGIGIAWIDLALALTPEFRTIVVDYPRGACSFDALADGLSEVLDAEHVDRAHVVGQSAGGMLAEVFSRRAPGRIRSLVFTGTGLYGPEDVERLEGRIAEIENTPWADYRELTRQALRAVWQDSGEAEFWTEQVDAAQERGGPRDAIGSLRMLLDLARRQPELRKSEAWQGPILVLKAADDRSITETHTRRLLDLHPGAELRMFPDGGHSLLVTRPRDYVEAVTGFLRAH